MAIEIPRFDGRTAAVSGAGGFIGGAVCAALADAGATVTGIDVDPGAAERVEATGARFARADVTDRAALERAIAGCELVVHTAAYVHEYGAMEEFVEVNVRGTANVLAAAASAGAERVVHLSSVVVYGYDHPGEQDESAGLRAHGNPYLDTKSASDRLARRRGAIVVRPGDVYGPRSSQWIARPAELARSGMLAVPGDGDAHMLPVFVSNLVDAILLALERGEPGEAYAVWDGEDVTFEEHFRRIAEIVGGRPPRRLPRPLLTASGRASEAVARLRGKPPSFTARAITFVDRRGTVSAERARRELGWEPRVPYDEGMRAAAEWLRGARAS